MTIAARNAAPVLINEDGSFMSLDTSLPVSADDAGRILPKLAEAIRQARRYEGFLRDTLSAAMSTAGQTERLIDGTLWSLKPEATWVITNEGAMCLALEGAALRNDITDIELLHAMKTEVSVTFNHTSLNSLAKRLPEIDQYRSRVESVAKLSTKK